MRTLTSRRPTRRVALASVLAVALAGAASAAYASELPSQVSTNWAGYAAVTGSSTRAFAKHFTSVSGTWVQPSATCVAGEPTFSAFWVGLGGYKQSSKALEQVGSEADCNAAGQVSYYAWYEYVPRGPVNIRRITVAAGDTISAKVSVRKDRATVSLTDETTGVPFTHVQRMRNPHPDVSAAEWIAEAPSNCNQKTCRPLTLTNFGSISFSAASATSVGTDGRHAGAIDDPDWIYGAISLQSRALQQRSFLASRQPSSASVGALEASGNAFTVTYTSGQPQTGPSGLTGTTGTTGATSTAATTVATPP
jgi:hypothetical protein